MSDITVGLIILEIGAILVLGFAGAFLMKKIHVPQVLGFILSGFIIGLPNRYWQSFISESFLDSVTPTITTLALGFIGFNIGAELSWKELRKMDRKIILILLADSIGTFVIVTFLVGITGILSWNFAAILGALASATAPAATADVLWEYKASGPLTQAVLFILAIDDIIAIFLVQITTNITKGQIVGDISGWNILAEFGLEAGAAIGIGIVFGFVITLVINRVKDHGDIMELTLGSLIVVLGLSIIIGSSAILAAMIFGVIIVSVSRKSDRETQEVFHDIYKIGSPVVAVFFILVGFRMNPADLLLIGGIGAIYLVGRTLGKVGAVSLTARVVKSPKEIQRYLGICLFSQAGVALGLAVKVFNDFPASVYGDAVHQQAKLVLTTITGTIIVVQIIGPLLVKWAIHRAGEVGGKTEQLHVAKATLHQETINDISKGSEEDTHKIEESKLKKDTDKRILDERPRKLWKRKRKK